MLITLELPGELADRLQEEAVRQGLSIDQYVIRAARNELAQPSSIGTPSLDPHLASALARTRAATAELVRQGIIDRDGNRLRTDMPEDMREGADSDFGG